MARNTQPNLQQSETCCADPVSGVSPAPVGKPAECPAGAQTHRVLDQVTVKQWPAHENSHLALHASHPRAKDRLQKRVGRGDGQVQDPAHKGWSRGGTMGGRKEERPFVSLCPTQTLPSSRAHNPTINFYPHIFIFCVFLPEMTSAFLSVFRSSSSTFSMKPPLVTPIGQMSWCSFGIFHALTHTALPCFSHCRKCTPLMKCEMI